MEQPPEPAVAPSLRPSRDRTARRWPAILLSLLAPGLGHLAIGHPRRLVAWFATLLVIVALTIGGALAGAPATILVAVVASVLLRLAAAVDTVRLERSHPLPRPRVVVLLAIGLFAFWNVVALGVRARVLFSFVVPSDGMYPTVQTGDDLFVTKLDRKYRAGDVIVLRDPGDLETQYVKRIIGVSGDRVLFRNGAVIVNEQAAPREPTTRPCAPTEAGPCTIWQEKLGGHAYAVAHVGYGSSSRVPLTVPPGAFFVVGDNRENSGDSRMWGPVKESLIDGKVTGIWWSGGNAVRWDRVFLRIQ